MVPILKNQALADQPTLRVYSDDGEYADTDLILCSEVGNPGVPSAMLAAQFVKYGAIVYRFNTPEELGAAIFAIDPDSTLDAVALYKEQVARDAARNAGTLTPSDPVPTPDSPNPPADVPVNPTDSINTNVPDTSGQVLGESTTTTATDIPYSPPSNQSSLVAPSGPISTTTPDINVSSTTPAFSDASTTPPVAPVPDISATTSPTVDISTTTPE